MQISSGCRCSARKTVPLLRTVAKPRKRALGFHSHPRHRSGTNGCSWTVICRSYEQRRELDAEFMEAMDEACDRTHAVVAEGDPKAVDALHDEFASTWMYLMEEEDLDSANFVAVLQGFLQHTIIDNVSELKGPYLRSYKRLYNVLQGLKWELRRETPRRTCDEREANGNGQTGRAVSKLLDYYELLEVKPTAEKEEIRNSYRSLALKWHPDVNQQGNATDVFVEIRKAYDVLSDPKSRKLYDTYGADGMESMSDAHAGDGNADRFWNEFKPFTKQSRKTKARNAAIERMEDSESESEPEPMAGDVVEYPLSDHVKAELQDGRDMGVGLLVGRNKDRGDAAKLPSDLLGMCEIEPLRQEHAHSTTWIPDEIGCSAFCELSSLTKIPVSSYDNRHDTWVIESALSEGCGGPEIVEEIVL